MEIIPPFPWYINIPLLLAYVYYGYALVSIRYTKLTIEPQEFRKVQNPKTGVLCK